MEVTVPRVRSPGFTSAVATGVTIIGPSPDGFFHVTFWREGIRMIHERFRTIDPNASSIDGQAVVMAEGGQHTEMVREEVATILIPIGRFAGMVEALGKVEVPTDLAVFSGGQVSVGPG